MTLKKTIIPIPLVDDGAIKLKIEGPGKPFTVKLPKNSWIITAQILTRRERFTNKINLSGAMWIMTDADKLPEEINYEERTFVIVIAGQEFEIPAYKNYIGCYQLSTDTPTFFLFEITEPSYLADVNNIPLLTEKK